ncbi:hypothetical protein F5050DRAFT_1813134 [Lentinula boryana]|uniref:Uncharacterized protein n=1 Tax=Lentinula boryana TaxID=40481 RepID=A0ABQ8PX19_9AGAR|nr:hypothetical protein F5050DRAFT_1813134 [Lentinula boryana]
MREVQMKECTENLANGQAGIAILMKEPSLERRKEMVLAQSSLFLVFSSPETGWTISTSQHARDGACGRVHALLDERQELALIPLECVVYREDDLLWLEDEAEDAAAPNKETDIKPHC